MGLIAQLTRHKTVEQLQAEALGSRDFRRVMGVWQLTAIGVGAIIGVGIFVLAGQQAAVNAGPAVVLSFLIAGLGSACAALAYAEFAGMIPVTGSAYTYSYAVLGELVAWIIGWDLLVEYALIVGVVAIGWSGYVQALLDQLFGLQLPLWARAGWDPATPDSGHVFNVIAAAVVLLATAPETKAARAARDAGARVCIIRTAPVATLDNPLYRLQLPLFRLGLGARRPSHLAAIGLDLDLDAERVAGLRLDRRDQHGAAPEPAESFEELLRRCLELERQHFMELIATEKTQARIEHMLKTGKPLRN